MRRDDLGLSASAGTTWDGPWSGSPEVRDTPAEVDAVFRTLRRIAGTYFIVFLLLVAAFPVLTMALDWWSEAQLVGDLSPGFLAAGIGLYVVFAIIGIAAATLSSSVESRMLGQGGLGAEHVIEESDEAHPGEGGADESVQQHVHGDAAGRILLDAAVPPESPFSAPGAEAATDEDDADPRHGLDGEGPRR